MANAPAVWVQMSCLTLLWKVTVGGLIVQTVLLHDSYRHLVFNIIWATVNITWYWSVCFFCRPFNVCSMQPQLGADSYIFSHDSVLHYLFLSLLWTLDLWFDALLPNSQPISPILLNQYVCWRMFTLTDRGWQKSTQTFAGCPLNNPFVYRGWGDWANLGYTIPISITGDLSHGWGWNRVHVNRHTAFTSMF